MFLDYYLLLYYFLYSVANNNVKTMLRHSGKPKAFRVHHLLNSKQTQVETSWFT